MLEVQIIDIELQYKPKNPKCSTSLDLSRSRKQSVDIDYRFMEVELFFFCSRTFMKILGTSRLVSQYIEIKSESFKTFGGDLENTVIIEWFQFIEVECECFGTILEFFKTAMDWKKYLSITHHQTHRGWVQVFGVICETFENFGIKWRKYKMWYIIRFIEVEFCGIFEI